jgi:hypothetical protein
MFTLANMFKKRFCYCKNAELDLGILVHIQIRILPKLWPDLAPISYGIRQ